MFVVEPEHCCWFVYCSNFALKELGFFGLPLEVVVVGLAFAFAAGRTFSAKASDLDLTRARPDSYATFTTYK